MFVSGCSFSSFTVPMMGDGFALLAQYIRSNLFNDLHCMSGRLWLGYQAMLLPLGRLQAYWLPRSRAQQNQKKQMKERPLTVGLHKRGFPNNSGARACLAANY